MPGTKMRDAVLRDHDECIINMHDVIQSFITYLTKLHVSPSSLIRLVGISNYLFI